MQKSKLKTVLTLTAAGALLALRASADPINLGFETGDLTGWSVYTGISGSAAVVTSATSSSSATYDPVEGTYFADLFAGAGANVDTTIYQSFTLNAGETLTGDVAFLGHDYLPFDDSAFADIAGASTGDTTLFSASIGTAGNYGSTPWTTWSFTAPTTDTYTLTYGVANGLDNGLASEAIFDAKQSVPDGASTFFLMGVGFLGLAALKQKIRRRPEYFMNAA